MITKGMMSSDREDWATPQAFFDTLNKEFKFTLDVCATDKTHKCTSYFTKEANALTKSWADAICWMNPPYGRTIGQWMKKAYEESCKGTTVVCLVPARTDTRWWHDYASQAEEIRFVAGRLHFDDAETGAPFPSAVVIFRYYGFPQHIRYTDNNGCLKWFSRKRRKN